MANFDPEKLKVLLSGIAQKVLLAQTQAVNESMLELKADFIQRIFQDGKDVDGNLIGQYSTKAMYVSIPEATKRYGSQISLSGLKPRGKKKGEAKANRSSKFKVTTKRFRTDEDDFTAKVKTERTSMYLPGGYKEFRELVGRLTDKVDLSLTFALRDDIDVRNNDGQSQLTFLKDDEVKKAGWAEERFKKIIFSPSEAELDIVVERWREDVSNAFLNSFE